ncbi:MAG: CpsB/CapC family capsule biosynthesis tyrosine phosphatase [Gemmatimonadales bacterium]
MRLATCTGLDSYRMLDFHNHLMPGVDDGAADLDESRAGLAVMREQGVSTIITTPHIRGSLTDKPRELERYLGLLDSAFSALEDLTTREFPELRIERGVEMMLDLPAPDVSDPRLRLAGSTFVLLEFPYMSIPPNSAVAIREIRASGLNPVIAHPERYSNMAGRFELVESWRDAGASIQVNSGSFVGQYGSTAKRLAWLIVERGFADYMCSDYHARGRCAIKAAQAAFDERGGSAQHRLLTVTNPERILRSELPLPVEPLEEVQLGFWRKVFGK